MDKSSPLNIADKPKQCENCKSDVSGAYCTKCGQATERTLQYFWTVILHLLDDIFSFDSRANRTMVPLLFRPGFLTNEYIAGRRVHYVPPLRLYLFISIIFFISLKFFTNTETSIFESERPLLIEKVDSRIQHLTAIKTTSQDISVSDELKLFRLYKLDLTSENQHLRRTIAQEIVELEFDRIEREEPLRKNKLKQYEKLTKQLADVRQGITTKDNPAAFTISNNKDGTLTFSFLTDDSNKKLTNFAKELEIKATKAFENDPKPLISETLSKLPQLMFILLPLFALLLKLMFIFKQRLYLEHLTVALHSHSFIFLSSLIIEILSLGQTFLQGSLPAIANTFDGLSIVVFIWIPIYLYLMQKRVYKQGHILTFIKFNIIALSYFTLIAFTGVIAFIWGLIDS